MIMQDIKKVKLIIGLGNPGEKYAATYHNVGQLFISYIIQHETWSIKYRSFLASRLMFRDSRQRRGSPGAARSMIYIVKPLTFMNESGKAVKSALKYFGLKPENLLVIHDDSDIELGKYKLSFGQSSAGHKGIESIIKLLGAKNFWRLRIGIRQDAELRGQSQRESVSRMKAGDLVLKKIKKDDRLTLQKVFESIEVQLQ